MGDNRPVNQQVGLLVDVGEPVTDGETQNESDEPKKVFHLRLTVELFPNQPTEHPLHSLLPIAGTLLTAPVASSFRF